MVFVLGVRLIGTGGLERGLVEGKKFVINGILYIIILYGDTQECGSGEEGGNVL